MKHYFHPAARAFGLALITVVGHCLLCGCERKDQEIAAVTPAHSQDAAPSNRIDISAAVRQNLGITFAKVQVREVARTLRVPGRFELLPTATREYRAAAGGTVEVLVSQYQTVAVGTLLYQLRSPGWRELQRELAEAQALNRVAAASAASITPLLAAHENHHDEIQRAVDLWSARVATLEGLQAAGGARGEEVAAARAAMASSRSDLAETLEKEAELLAQREQTAAQLDAARSKLSFLFERAATFTGTTVAELQTSPTDDPQLALWRTLGDIEVRASNPGVVQTVDVPPGGLIEQHERIISTVQPELVRFRAVALQSDLPRLADGLVATVVPARAWEGHEQGGAESVTHQGFSGRLMLAPTADPERRTLDLILEPGASSAAPPSWARAGVSAFIEIVTNSAGSGELAIPLGCVARDGTASIIFRRDPADPNQAIRMEADLGLSDGRWVVIRSGVGEGNEVVLDGVYQLMVATSGSITKGGHFHPDGSFHEGED